MERECSMRIAVGSALDQDLEAKIFIDRIRKVYFLWE